MGSIFTLLANLQVLRDGLGLWETRVLYQRYYIHHSPHVFLRLHDIIKCGSRARETQKKFTFEPSFAVDRVAQHISTRKETISDRLS